MNPGFYKNDEGVLLCGPNFVLNKDYELRADQHEAHTYPVDGWYWFNSEEEARIVLNIPQPEPEPEPEPEPKVSRHFRGRA